MLVLFIHMVHKTSVSTVASAESNAKMREKLTRMVGIASLLLIWSCLRDGKPDKKLLKS